MKTIDKLRKMRFVGSIDDDRAYGDGYIVTLAEGWNFRDDPGCGVRGFDTIAEAAKTVKASNVYRKSDLKIKFGCDRTWRDLHAKLYNTGFMDFSDNPSDWTMKRSKQIWDRIFKKIL